MFASPNARHYSYFKMIGHADFLVAVMCNPNWPKIRGELLPGQLPQDIPDLAVRLSMMKLGAMMSYMIDKKSFSNFPAYIQVVNFQKQGLNYAHCTFFLTDYLMSE